MNNFIQTVSNTIAYSINTISEYSSELPAYDGSCQTGLLGTNLVTWRVASSTAVLGISLMAYFILSKVIETRQEQQFRIDLEQSHLQPEVARAITHSKHSLKHRRALKEAFVAKKIFRDTHYVFAHGFSGAWGAFNKVSLELQKRLYPNRDWEHREFAFPIEPSSLTPISIRETPSFIDNFYRGQLLSVTPDFLDETGAESALSFFCSNSSQSRPNWDCCEKLLLTYIGGESVIGRDARNRQELRDLATEFEQLISTEHESRNESRLGIGYGGLMSLLFVPKTLAVGPDLNHLSVYRSHSCGKPCECHDSSKDTEILDSFQNEHDLSHYRCKNGFNTQYRIIVSKDTQEKVLSKIIDCAPDWMREKLNRRIASFVKKVDMFKKNLSMDQIHS